MRLGRKMFRLSKEIVEPAGIKDFTLGRRGNGINFVHDATLVPECLPRFS